MKHKKNFFYRVNPESVLSELTSIDHVEWLQFFLNFFHDLRNDDPENSKTVIAKEIIREAHNFRELRSKAGKASVKQKTTNVKHMLKGVTTEDQQNATSSSTQSRKEAKARSSDDELLTGFDLFWAAFNYKEGKKPALESWRKIKGYSDGLLVEIIAGAEREANRRSSLITKGQTPKMAQGWLTERRWEDEIIAIPQERPMSQREKVNRAAGEAFLQGDVW